MSPSACCKLGRGAAYAGAGLVAVSAGVTCIGKPDALAALILIPGSWWLLAGLATTALVWCCGGRVPAAWLLLAWSAFAAGWVEEIPAGVRSLLGSGGGRRLWLPERRG